MSRHSWWSFTIALLLVAIGGVAALAWQDEEFEDAFPLTTVDPVVSPMTYQGGTVVLRVSVSATGGVSDIEVVTGHPGLTDAVLAAVRQWRFRPARQENRPVPSRTTVAVHVALQRNVAPPVR